MLKLTPTCELSVLELALFPRYNSRSRPVITTRELRAAVRRKSQVLAQLETIPWGTGPPTTCDKGVLTHVVVLSLPAPGLDPQRKGADSSHECSLHGPGDCRLRKFGSHAFLSWDPHGGGVTRAHRSCGHLPFFSIHRHLRSSCFIRKLSLEFNLECP